MIYYGKRSVSLGELYRYTITLDPSFDDFQKRSNKRAFKNLWLRIRNTTSHFLRVAYFNGPYTLYVSVRGLDYSPFKLPLDFIPQYRQNLKAGSSFWVALPIPERCSDDSLKAEHLSKKKGWIVDIISQIVFSQSANVHFEIALSTSMQDIFWAGCFGVTELKDIPIKVYEQNTSQLWSVPEDLRLDDSIEKPSKKDIHFVVLTHGLHSNVNADMFYLKERIEEQGRISGENLVVSGYNGNVCRTDKGVEYLGKRLAEWVLKEVGWFSNKRPYYQKISFISHSLGGLVQLYAIGWIWIRTEGKFYDPSSNGLVPVNFVTLASPWLGLFAENPIYVTKALEYGIVGKTGKDLGLSMKHNKTNRLKHNKISRLKHSKTNRLTNQAIHSDNSLPFLSTLSSEKSPSRTALKLFERRTVYSNIINDEILTGVKKKNLNKYEKNVLLPIQSDKLNQYHFHEEKNKNFINTNYPYQALSTVCSNGSVETDASNFSLMLSPVDELQFSNIDKYKNSKHYNIPSNISKNMEFQNEIEYETNMQFNTNDFYPPKYNNFLPILKTDTKPFRSNSKSSHTSIYHSYDSSKLFKNKSESNSLETNKLKTNSFSSIISSFKTYLKIKRNKDSLKIKKNKKSGTINSTSTDYTYFCHKINLIPKMGFFRSARNVLSSPLPKKEYLINPCQTKTIIHDRYYYPEDIPKKFYKLDSKLDASQRGKNSLKRNKVSKEKLILEEKIAREWHADMIWRKVLVHLEPDAHNNIICRRMFVNAYGWPVIEHLVLNHF
ncbi:unnamed protein product [Pneumocystis jirovecii]|uniref:DUF676 domain-containing protein n=1 Tax=Pneumocystis jirovecii TaxID=42068 RepID=L0PBY0_PNEJI|nr:unnamed protein product [Pneumocystis jirovecii]